MTGDRDVKSLFEAWRTDPDYVAAYDALDEEFSVIRAVVGARARAGISQAELAARIGADQASISRWESGKAVPSTRTLRKIAVATDLELVITFQPRRRAKVGQMPSREPVTSGEAA